MTVWITEVERLPSIFPCLTQLNRDALFLQPAFPSRHRQCVGNQFGQHLDFLCRYAVSLLTCTGRTRSVWTMITLNGASLRGLTMLDRLESLLAEVRTIALWDQDYRGRGEPGYAEVNFVLTTRCQNCAMEPVHHL